MTEQQLLIRQAIAEAFEQHKDELIGDAVDKAVAKHLSQTIRLLLNDRGQWAATSGDHQNYAIGVGSTPEEALAKLRAELKDSIGLTEVEQALIRG